MQAGMKKMFPHRAHVCPQGHALFRSPGSLHGPFLFAGTAGLCGAHGENIPEKLSCGKPCLFVGSTGRRRGRYAEGKKEIPLLQAEEHVAGHTP